MRRMSNLKWRVNVSLTKRAFAAGHVGKGLTSLFGTLIDTATLGKFFLTFREGVTRCELELGAFSMLNAARLGMGMRGYERRESHGQRDELREKNHDCGWRSKEGIDVAEQPSTFPSVFYTILLVS